MKADVPAPLPILQDLIKTNDNSKQQLRHLH
jgi:hypothetical protein